VTPNETLVGGAMMGRLAAGLDEPVTKTTGGLIVIPADHGLVPRYRRDWNAIARIGRSACDQCSFCTEMCPRYLLGHPIEPHRAMRALGFLATREPEVAGTLYCCECNLCTLVACPEALDPKNVCVEFKKEARKKGLLVERPFVGPHPLQASRRVPMKRLIRRLGLAGFVNEGPLVLEDVSTRRVVLPLKQHVGAPSLPVVRPGERVRVGDPVGRPADGALGAVIHASIEGTVRSVDGSVVIEA
jgi:Na+-translocating ferredoxin:NAD+ oxidoreductase RnfC subunit